MKINSHIRIMLCMLSFLCSCFSFNSSSSDYEKIADKITEKTAKRLKEQKGLYLVGTGGRMMHDIEMMMMGFNFYRAVDMETARELLVNAVQEYLSAINSNKEIKPYLHNDPFTAQNVHIVIYFYNPNGSNVASDKINIAAVNRGKVTYYMDDPEKHTIKAIYEESYQEGFRVVLLTAP